MMFRFLGGIVLGVFMLQAAEIPENITRTFDINWDKCDQVIDRKRYRVCYNYKTKLADFVVYKVTKDDNGCKNPRPHRFLYDNTIPNEYRAKDQWYKRTGYDRGHLMPNAVINCDVEAQKETFILSNVAPQDPKLNRKAWKQLETLVRRLSQKTNVWVQTGVKPGEKTLKGNVNIPIIFYKKILYGNNLATYVLPNREVKDYRKYKYKYIVDVNTTKED